MRERATRSGVRRGELRVPTLFWMKDSGKVGGERVSGRPAEHPPTEVQATENGVDPVLAGDLSRVAEDVDDPGLS